MRCKCNSPRMYSTVAVRNSCRVATLFKASVNSRNLGLEALNHRVCFYPHFQAEVLEQQARQRLA